MQDDKQEQNTRLGLHDTSVINPVSLIKLSNNMSTITSHSRVSKDANVNTTLTPKQLENRAVANDAARTPEVKLEGRLNTRDLEALQEAFMADGDGYDNRLSLDKDQFCEALSLILSKGSKQEYADLFDKVDITKEGVVDWDKFANHMLLEFYERDDRVKSTQVPQWKDLKTLTSPHKEIIQRVTHLKNSNRYLAISKEGCVSMWGPNLKLQRSLKTGTDACRARDLWVTHFVILPNINKIALAFTSKEIAIYDLSTKLEFNCQYKVQGLYHTPLTLDYWSNPSNANEAILVWGDTGGCVYALHFSSANIALFERPSAPAGDKQEPCLNVILQDILKKKYKNTHITRHQGHTEWVRQVKHLAQLECFISCATTWDNSLVIGWMEKHASSSNMRTTCFQISQGVNAFDYHQRLNLIATAGVNHHVCLWNPYVVSKPNGVLRGHMAAVVQVQFNKPRSQLISFSKDKVLRIWDVQLQVCIQRLAGMFPKGPEVTTMLFFDDRTNRLFITFNYQLTVMEMKPEIKDRVLTHDRPVVAGLFNSTYNQVVTACQGGRLQVWMLDTGQKVKQFVETHGGAEVTTLTQDTSETRLFTGSTDGTVKIWDFNGHCYHTLQCGLDGQPADLGTICVLKRSVLVVGWTKYLTVFRNQNFRDFHIDASDWKGGQEHSDDILSLAFLPPHTLASGSYDGEIIIWNNNSEQASKHLRHRSRRSLTRGHTFATTRENTRLSEAGGFDSHTFLSERPPTRAKSRAASRISAGSNDENNEYGYAVSRLAFLETRRGESMMSTGANLVSCGGNGWVRFWNTNNGQLLAEFVAHTQVGSVIMAIDQTDHWLVTGDVDGSIKVWDISTYCTEATEDIYTQPPPFVSQFQPHQDMVNSLVLCERQQRTLIISSSSDCSVVLTDVLGNQIGVFGQEQHWKIEPFSESESQDEDQLEQTEDGSEEDERENDFADDDFQDTIDWKPDEQAVLDPSNFRLNTWHSSHIGKDYQELRLQKRERKQPGVIQDLPYLHWERTGQPPAGPYAALETSMLKDVSSLAKPDFIHNPHKYFSERSALEDQTSRLPVLAESLHAAFDEKTLFPKYLLDFEARMKQYHAKAVNDTQRRGGNLRTSLTGAASNSSSLGQYPQLPGNRASDVNINTVGNYNNSSHRGHSYMGKPARLRPLAIKTGSIMDGE